MQCIGGDSFVYPLLGADASYDNAKGLIQPSHNGLGSEAFGEGDFALPSISLSHRHLSKSISAMGIAVEVLDKMHNDLLQPIPAVTIPTPWRIVHFLTHPLPELHGKNA